MYPLRTTTDDLLRAMRGIASEESPMQKKATKLMDRYDKVISDMIALEHRHLITKLTEEGLTEIEQGRLEILAANLRG